MGGRRKGGGIRQTEKRKMGWGGSENLGDGVKDRKGGCM